MSISTLQKIRLEALELCESDRASLASDLLSSLDGPPDKDAEQAWEQEIARRLAEFEAGKITTVSADEVISSIRKRLAAKK